MGEKSDDRIRFLEKIKHAERVYGHLTSCKHSREHPSYPEKILECLYPLFVMPPLIGLWGGSKESSSGKADLADSTALDNLYKTLFDATSDEGELDLKGHYMSLESNYVYLVFCDSHHIVANGVAPEKSDAYYQSLVPMVESTPTRVDDAEFERSRADPNYHVYNYSIGHDSKHFKIIKLSEILEEMAGVQSVYDMLGTIDGHAISEARKLMQTSEFAAKAKDAASKHSKIPFDSRDAALIYVAMEISFLERLKQYKTNRFAGINFCDGMFFSFSDPYIQKPIAEAAGVPMFFFHSFDDRNDVPWYVEMK